MDEIVDLMNEYRVIADKESLYARVLMSFIVEREQRMRRELERQIAVTTRDREHCARLRHFARTAPLERLVALYENDRTERGGGVKQQHEAWRAVPGPVPITSMMTYGHAQRRLAATEQRLKELKESRKAADKARRQAYKQSKVDRERKVMLVGEAVLRRVERGEWNEADFRQMMDEALSRPAGRGLFDLD